MEVFDRKAALERAGGDAERLNDRLEDFQIRLPALKTAIEKAASRKREARLRELAEELQALAEGIGAEGMAALAVQMQQAADAHEFEPVETLLVHVEMEADWLSRILDENRCSGNL